MTATALQSMTGFARVEGEHGALAWVWEAKSVNARGLDVRVRVPAGFDRFEPKIREALRGPLARGTVSVSLIVGRGDAGRGFRLNEDLLAVIAQAQPALRAAMPDAAPPTLDGVMAVRGLFEPEDSLDGGDPDGLDEVLEAGLGDLVRRLVEQRRSEGANLAEVLSGHLETMGRLIAEARAQAAAQPEAIRARFEEQVAQLIGERAAAIGEDRLAQEVAVLATKADIREELDRLDAHVGQSRVLLAGTGPVGRKLDFLSQEFNREANTLCAKAGDLELGRVGLDLKTVIDQFKEQVQNVE